MVKYLLHKIIDIGTFAKKCHLYCSRGHVFLLDMFCKNKQKYGLVIVTIINMTSFCSISFLSLFLSKEVAQKGSHFYIFDFPVKFSVFVTTISSLFLGIIVPKHQLKNVFIGAVIISRIATTLFGVLHFISDVSIYTSLAFFLRGIEAAGACAYFICGYVIIFTTFLDDAGVIRGFLETAVEIGTTVGPAVGDLLFTFEGTGLPFYLVGLFSITLAVVGHCSLDKLLDSSKNYHSFASFIKIPTVFITFCVITTVSITSSSLDPTLGQYFMDLVQYQKSGYVYLTVATAFAVSSSLWNYFTEKASTFEWMIPTGLCLTGFSIIFLESSCCYTSTKKNFMVIKMINVCMLGIFMAMALVPTFRCLTLAAFEKGFENNVATHSYVISTWTFIFAVGEILGPSAGLIFYKQYSFAVFSFSLAALNILMGIIYTVFLYCKINNHNVFCSFNVTIYFQ